MPSLVGSEMCIRDSLQGRARRSARGSKSMDAGARIRILCRGGRPLFPKLGFSMVINKPHALIMTAVWPWAPAEMRAAQLP